MRSTCLPRQIFPNEVIADTSTAQASPAQGTTEKAAWVVKMAADTRASSNIAVENLCNQSHHFTVVPQNVPYLQLPAPPTITVPGRSAQNMFVTFNTTGMRPGQYEGIMDVRCDDCPYERGCFQKNERLRVQLTVLPAAAPSPKLIATPTPRDATPRPTLNAIPQLEEGESSSCRDERCRANKMILSTGYNEATGWIHSLRHSDSSWEVVDAPYKQRSPVNSGPPLTGTNKNISFPVPAIVIAPHPTWTTSPNSQWISLYPVKELADNNPAQVNKDDPYYPPYTFQQI